MPLQEVPISQEFGLLPLLLPESCPCFAERGHGPHEEAPGERILKDDMDDETTRADNRESKRQNFKRVPGQAALRLLLLWRLVLFMSCCSAGPCSSSVLAAFILLLSSSSSFCSHF